MKISDVIETIKAEIIFKRTPSGRPITDYAIKFLSSALEDQKNYNMDAVICNNCCIIQSSLLVPEGCKNCGAKDLSTEIAMEDTLQKE